MVHYTSEMLSPSSRWETCQLNDKSLDADGMSYQAYYSEAGKAHYTSTQSFGSAGKGRDLNKGAASCVDKVTAEAYQENLEANIQNLAKRLKEKRYRAKLVRRCYIPKDNGKQRPLGIPALEDRLVQLACSWILTSIFESDFVETSYGYRPNRSAKEAIEDLQFNLQFGKYGYIVEADIRGFLRISGVN